MKKILYWAMAVIVLLPISFFIFLQYRSSIARQAPIHRNANAILQINIDDILLKIAFNFIKNPTFYLDQKPKKTPNGEPQSHGLNLPSYLFLYSIKGLKNDTFVGSIAIDDIDVLKQFLNRKFNNSPFKKGKDNIHVSTALNGKLTFAYSSERLAFAFSNTKENVTSILTDLLLKKNLWSNEAVKMKQLHLAEHHISYHSTNAAIAIDFEDGKIKISGQLDSLKTGKDRAITPYFHPESAIQFYTNLELTPLFNRKTYQVGNFKLTADSILKYHQGATTFELLKTTSQSDTSITYTYNDDFEKVEKKTITTVQIPEMSLSLDGNGNAMAKYLRQQGILTKRDSLNKQFFPLYTVYASPSENDLTLSTSKFLNGVPSNKKQSNALWLKIDFEKIKRINEFALLNDWLNEIMTLELALVPNGKKLTLDGTINMKNLKINSMVQLK